VEICLSFPNQVSTSVTTDLSPCSGTKLTL